MKKLLRDIITIRKDLVVIFFIAISIIILIDFVLSDIPEIFKGGAKLGVIIYKICLAYIAAFIFYFLGVHLKQQKDKDNIYQYIAKKTYMIIGDAKSLISSLKEKSGVELKSEYPTKEELEEICKKVNPNSNAPLLLGKPGNYANWFQYFKYYKDRTEDALERIYVKMQYLDSDYIKLLVNVEDCTHLKMSDFLNKMPIGNMDLTALTQQLYEYFESINKLELHADKNLKAYKIRYQD